jgi:hypothetical protein
MEAMVAMKVFSDLFGIFRQRGLVDRIKEGRSLFGFSIAALVLSIIGAVLYGFAMGVGLGIDTALKDALKVGLIATLGVCFSIPVFWVAYRLLGRDERLAQVAAVPLTFVATVSILLAVTAPVVFMLSVLTGHNPEAVYIHIVIVDLALLVGLYLAGMLVYHSFPDPKRLIIPNVIGFLMMGVILVVLMGFLGPFLEPSATFSVGTDRLKDGLGIGVRAVVDQALDAAESADRVTYRFQIINENGDLTRDYTVTRLGNDALVEVHFHSLPEESAQSESHIWILDGDYFTDFDAGKVSQVAYADLISYLGDSLPQAAFQLPPEFDNASWRAYEREGILNATGTTPDMAKATLLLEDDTGRLTGLILGSAERGAHAERRVGDIGTAVQDRAALESSLNQAIVLGSVDHTDASMRDYAQSETFFVARYPKNWRAESWSATKQQVTFSAPCRSGEDCTTMTVNVYDLVEGATIQTYVDDLARSLDLQPEYRDFQKDMAISAGRPVGKVEYLFDELEEGEVKTTQHLVYIFDGQDFRYHLDFSAPVDDFETRSALFDEMARLFVYLDE